MTTNDKTAALKLRQRRKVNKVTERISERVCLINCLKMRQNDFEIQTAEMYTPPKRVSILTFLSHQKLYGQHKTQLRQQTKQG